ncbi:fumarylacetoacetate hydrolase [Marinactinospora thermotolerans DSM 45154]|uniref:fumarylacetoacetase n=1 Tax=Marinactinospora thermotolerans DSM 45154 TaxID=1122192 RepID=A0A1T4RNJ8_9ACTN|nr:fumarylacetoacetate hydrolase family protein [Marinactinospora thermotolerans]SKA17513.1 fumarylacetoacetate hydrolase [Marinactinospora thermotolerans DSM 45154]
MAHSWVPGADTTGFGADNLPYGVFSRGGGAPRVGVRIGEFVLDLAGTLGDPEFCVSSLAPFMARGSTAWRATRAKIGGMLTSDSGRARAEPHLVPLADVTLHPPFEITDLTFFQDTPRTGGGPRHFPVGHHGRAGTVVLSGGDIARPSGQYLEPGADIPTFGPSREVDVGAALGFVIGAPTPPGRSVPVSDFAQHVFGVVVAGEWSARDLQGWEGGPLLGPAFATSISPWVVPLDALGAARRAGREQSPPPLPYLRRVADWGLDVTLEIRLNGRVVSRPPYASTYWTADQMLAHLTSGGAPLRTGDLYVSGAVSGEERDEEGTLVEPGGAEAAPVLLDDGDRVVITAAARGMSGGTIRLGEVTAVIHSVRG